MKSDLRKTNSLRSGSILPLTVVAIAVMVTLGVGLLELDLQSKLTANRDGFEITARAAADAGLIKAISEMNQKLQNKPWNDSTLPQATDDALPNCEATCTYVASGDKANGYSITSTGDARLAQRTVNASLRLKGLFDFAVFTKEALSLKNGTKVDWYMTDPTGQPLKVGTNSTATGSVALNSGVTINGDIAVGVSGDPTAVIDDKSGVTVAGDSYALTEEQKLPIIDVPDALKSDSSKGSITGSLTILTSGKYNLINIGNSKVIMINGPVTLYITGDITLDSSAQIQINNANPNASLNLFLGGNLVFKNGGFVNNLTKDPKRFLIFGLANCRSIDFRTAGNFYGAIYAPNADVMSHNSVQIYGAIVANSFIQDVWANLYYDASLRNVSYDDIGVRFTVARWYEN